MEEIMTKTKKRAAWCRDSEAATLKYTPGDLGDARDTYLGKLTKEEQWEFAREITQSRRSELCLAYRSVVAVGTGYLQKSDGPDGETGDKGKPRLVRTPGVIFHVRRKWGERNRGRPEQEIPRDLFGYWTVDGERRLCAVPTDVVEASVRADFIPENGLVVESESGLENATGAIACRIKRKSNDDQTYLLSCRHVFGLSEQAHPANNSGASVRLRNSSDVVALVDIIRGSLDSGISDCVDAQLARVEDESAAISALGGIRFERDNYAMGPWDIPDEYYIHAPGRSEPIHVEKVSMDEDVTMSYPLAGTWVSVQLAYVLYYRGISDTTRGGDSGSPITSHRDGGKFLGMHIGRSDNSHSDLFAIPSWILMNSTHYPLTSELGEVWKLLPS